MNNPDAFERILASLYDAMLDETRRASTSALIDEACGLTGNGLMVALKARRTTSGLSSSGSTPRDSAAKTWWLSTPRFRLSAPDC